ncbi:Hypothetical protein, putative [Bodo saltans]|uniref:Uncharacterized protein n=1 Tax=Bodo saltans TaxID=75058 RepID=A0A0S4JV46_BODSA|nr:Hypothetical protein, putative [Bodo saltans]|eukprot:CUG93265.1 Hypothetical protein, putative [Bodo saltans]
MLLCISGTLTYCFSPLGRVVRKRSFHVFREKLQAKKHPLFLSFLSPAAAAGLRCQLLKQTKKQTNKKLHLVHTDFFTTLTFTSDFFFFPQSRCCCWTSMPAFKTNKETNE